MNCAGRGAGRGNRLAQQRVGNPLTTAVRIAGDLCQTGDINQPVPKSRSIGEGDMTDDRTQPLDKAQLVALFGKLRPP